ncbi:MAG: energy transducer TonB [Alphaproteobacteria bacterium]|nr:energy transducer TonB [Alphaproteobacteria bacterium]
MMATLSSIQLPGPRHFVIAMAVAFAAHVLAFLLWAALYVPAPPPVEVKTIHIRLGAGGELNLSGQKKQDSAPRAHAEPIAVPAAQKAPEPVMAQEAAGGAVMPDSGNVVTAPAAMGKPEASKSAVAVPAAKPDLPKAQKKPEKKVKSDSPWEIVRSEQPVTEKKVKLNAGANVAATTTRYTRESAAGGGTGAGSPFGNSAEAAQVVARYEQQIALWIEDHKRYPEDAKAAGMEGNAVARIRINANGKILKYALEVETGSPVLNRAVIDMIRRSDPVPPVPDNYPGASDLLEFLVPISFKLN